MEFSMPKTVETDRCWAMIEEARSYFKSLGVDECHPKYPGREAMAKDTEDGHNGEPVCGTW